MHNSNRRPWGRLQQCTTDQTALEEITTVHNSNRRDGPGGDYNSAQQQQTRWPWGRLQQCTTATDQTALGEITTVHNSNTPDGPGGDYNSAQQQQTRRPWGRLLCNQVFTVIKYTSLYNTYIQKWIILNPQIQRRRINIISLSAFIKISINIPVKH